MNIFQRTLSFTKSVTTKVSKKLSKPVVSLSIALSFGIVPLSASAATQGEFRITTNNGNRVDVYGDNFPSYKGPIHLWDKDYNSNLFVLRPSEATGNEIRVKADPTLCVTTDSPLGVKPAPGTPLVVKRDCANSFNFKFEGGKIYMGRYPDMCWDIPWNKDVVRQTLQIHPCNSSPAQQFNTGSNKQQQDNPTNQNKIISEKYEYEYWIVASGQNLYNGLLGYISKNATLNSMPGTTGHVFNTLIKRKVSIYANGSKNYSNWEVWKTYGVYGRSSQDKVGLRFNYIYELQTVNKILQGDPTANGVFEVRKSSISENRANWISNNYNVAGCDENGYNPSGSGNQCNCVMYATRSWKYFTANQENFVPDDYLGYNVYNRSPEGIAAQMRFKRADKNSQFNNVNVWE